MNTVSDLERDKLDHNPSADAIAGLRELADFLADHPELPPVWYGSVNFDPGIEDPRGRMRLIADALGDLATEKQHAADVTIEGLFTGGIALRARTSVSRLREDPQPVPEYEPIIPPRETVSLPVDDSDFDV